jgi:hypothetical protein
MRLLYYFSVCARVDTTTHVLKITVSIPGGIDFRRELHLPESFGNGLRSDVDRL